MNKKTTSNDPFRSSYEQVASEIDAVKEDQISSINIEVQSAVATMVTADHRRPEFMHEIEQLPSIDTPKVAKLGVYARALGATHADYLTATSPASPTMELIAAASAHRKVLLAIADLMVARGELAEGSLTNVRSSQGHLDIAFALSALASLLRSSGNAKEEELKKAEELSAQIMEVVGKRSDAPSRVAAVTLMRQKAFTLAVAAYDQYRRALCYLRWNEGDVDEIAPSLYAGRGGSRRKESSPEPGETPAAPAKPASPTPPARTTGYGPVGSPTSSPFMDEPK